MSEERKTIAAILLLLALLLVCIFALKEEAVKLERRITTLEQTK